MSKIKMTVQQLMDTVPPVLARMMAVKCGKGRRPELKTIDAIVADSGLSKRMVQRMVWQKHWNCRVEDASKFLVGCGVDILHKKQKYQFTRTWGDKNFPQITNPEMRTRFFKLMGW